MMTVLSIAVFVLIVWNIKLKLQLVKQNKTVLACVTVITELLSKTNTKKTPTIEDQISRQEVNAQIDNAAVRFRFAFVPPDFNVECSLCESTGTFNNKICPSCYGTGNSETLKETNNLA